MTQEPLLTIAIPTITQREKVFNDLFNEFKRQCEPFGDKIEIISICDNREMTIGEKRQKLNEMAKGKYVVQWDDDDWIHPDGIKLIMEGIETDVDVISYHYSSDIGIVDKVNHPRKVSIKYKNVLRDGIWWVSPDPKNPIKKEILDKVRFQDTSWSEEYYYKLDIKSLLKTEYQIDKYIYMFLNRSGEPYDWEKRYNLKNKKIL